MRTKGSDRLHLITARQEVSGQMTEDGGRKTEVRGQRSEVRGQRSEVRGQRSVACCQWSVVHGWLPRSPISHLLSPAAQSPLSVVSGKWSVVCRPRTPIPHLPSPPAQSPWSVVSGQSSANPHLPSPNAAGLPGRFHFKM